MLKRFNILAVLLLAATLTACKTPREAAEEAQAITPEPTVEVVEDDIEEPPVDVEERL